VSWPATNVKTIEPTRPVSELEYSPSQCPTNGPVSIRRR